MLDFSNRTELSLHGRVVADVVNAAGPLGVEVMIVGAFARDLHVHHEHGLAIERRTEDVDLALSVAGWDIYHALRARLLESEAFTPGAAGLHRLRHRDGLPVDLVPFAGVETAGRAIEWPPGGEIRMDVFGFREAMASAETVRLPGDVTVQVASVPALVLMKLVAWRERHADFPGRDADDLWLMLTSYLVLGNDERLWEEHPDWGEDPDFDYEGAGARLAGADMRVLAGEAGAARIAKMIEQQCDAQRAGRLPSEMRRRDPERARRLLVEVLRGLRVE